MQVFFDEGKIIIFIITELRPVTHAIHVLASEMIHFLHQTQYYFLFEVLECSWAEMLQRVTQAECLDDVINAHATFLSSVQNGVLLDGSSSVSEKLANFFYKSTFLQKQFFYKSRFLIKKFFNKEIFNKDFLQKYFLTSIFYKSILSKKFSL